MKAGFKAFSDQLADDLRANVGGLEPFLGSADRKVSAASAFKPMRGGGFDDGFMEVRFNEGLNADLAGITVHVEPGDRSFLAMGVNEASNAQRTHTGLLKLGACHPPRVVGCVSGLRI